MRLLNISLRSFLWYSLILVVVSIPLSFIAFRMLLNEEVNESLRFHKKEFLKHIKKFEYLDDLETDLEVLDEFTFELSINRTNNASQSEFIQTVLYFDSVEREQRPYRELVSPITIKGKDYVLVIRESLVESNDLAFAIGIVQSLVILFLVLGLVFINRRLSGKLWTPFYSTLNKLKQFQLDKSQSFEPEKTAISEFNDLNKAILNLTERSKVMYQQQKEFTENASHEMQTPLAVLHSKIDVLMQSPELTEAQALIIQDIATTSQRMSRLNRNLLLLSKLDNDQFKEMEVVDLASIINIVSANLEPFANAQGVIIEKEVMPNNITGNKTLIEILIINLLSNAIRYSLPNGEVMISFTKNKLVINNMGLPLAVSREKLFDRFSKDNSHPQSVGLGLAIVKRICDACNYNVVYDFKNDQHQFSITF